MGIKSPATYSDHYWKTSVDASKFFADEAEGVIASYMGGLLGDIPIIPEMPEGIKNFLRPLSKQTSFAFLPFMAGVGLNAIDEALDIAFEPAMLALKRNYGKRFKSKWLNATEVNLLWSRGKITEGLWDEVIAAEGYEKILGDSLYESQLPYPLIPDLVLYSRYHGDPDAPWGEFQKWFNLSPRDWPVWKWLGLQRLTTLQAQMLYKRGKLNKPDFDTELSRIGWSKDDRVNINDLSWTLPNAMLTVQGNLQQGKSSKTILSDIAKADIHPAYAQQYLDAILTKPSSTDVIAYMLRQDPKLSGVEAQLAKIGVHPAWTNVYRTLANPIPPTADLITMAVREAFTPAIAERFGQYEDFPPDFEYWAARKGLTPDWSKRYWASHWSLPSATQGFEMLHRGIIKRPELDMLLRALDIMPFWREKLTGIAYRRLSRVDIRRMYRVGVLEEAGVYEAYLELGYNERDAKRMTEFTVKQVLATQSKFTSGDIISAYSKRMIDSSEAQTLLLKVGVKRENIGFIISTAEYKRLWAMTESRIAGIRNLYRRRVYDGDKARAELLRLDLPAEQVSVLMEQWYFDKVAEPDRLWTTAQTLGFIKAELITKERGIKELREIGYDTEHLDVFMESIK